MNHHLLLVFEFILLSLALFGGWAYQRWPNAIWGTWACVFIVWLLIILEMLGQV